MTRFDTGCTIRVEHTGEGLSAHVELDGGVLINPGDAVRVHGDAVQVPFGGTLTLRRTATVTRAGPLARLWERVKGRFTVTELYEVGMESMSTRGMA